MRVLRCVGGVNRNYLQSYLSELDNAKGDTVLCR
jgi:hypothetical protein